MNEYIKRFEYVKTIVSKIRKDKIPRGLTLCINANHFTDDELVSIIYFESILKKMCKLEGIVYSF